MNRTEALKVLHLDEGSDSRRRDVLLDPGAPCPDPLP